MRRVPHDEVPKIVARRIPFGWRLTIATGVEAAWELLENSPIIIDRYRAVTVSFGYSGDSVLNSFAESPTPSHMAQTSFHGLSVCESSVTLLARPFALAERGFSWLGAVRA